MKTTKRERVLKFIIENNGATINEISEAFCCSNASARQFVSYLRKEGHSIKTVGYRECSCSYHVESTAKKEVEEPLTEKVRVILATLDEWTCREIADMCGVETKQISNTIGFLRRAGLNVVTTQISHHEFSYQQQG